MAVNSPTHTRQKQSRTFWLYILGAGGFLALNIARKSREYVSSDLILVVIAVVFVVVVVVATLWIALSVFKARVQNAKREFPGALIIPVTVGLDLSRAIQALAVSADRPVMKLKPGSNSIFVVNSNGIHISGKGRGPWLEFPAAQVSLNGFTSTVLGIRTVEAFVLSVESSGESYDLPLVPVRLRGNVAKMMKPNEVDEVLADVATALRGYPHDGWIR
jgi:hypothetical protein